MPGMGLSIWNISNVKQIAYLNLIGINIANVYF
ncbi:MAG: hypothetical protein QG646_2136 [Euryarchaeota archaeon]|nr:hypothetical protein [Euryarchaeota archaeon]